MTAHIKISRYRYAARTDTVDFAQPSAGHRPTGAHVPQRPATLTPYESALAFFGARLRQWRVRRGLSQYELGALVFVSRDLVGKVEKALRRPSYALIERLDAALETDGDLLGLALSVQATVGAEIGPKPPTPAPEFVGVGTSDIVNALRRVLDGFRQMDHSMGSGAVLQPATAQAKVVEGLLPVVSRTDQAGLLGVLAEIHQFIGWIQFDQLQLAGADTSFRLARGFAEQAEDPALLAYILGPSHGFSATYTGNAELGLRLTEQAAESARASGNRRLRAFVAAIQARSLARLGDSNGCLRQLDLAAEQLAHHDGPEGDAGWLSVFDEAALRGHAGSCQLDLGRPAEAIAPLSEEDATAPAAFVRNRTLWLLDRADALAALGEPGEAAADVRLAWNAAAGTSSPRIQQRLRTTISGLQRWNALTEVADLRELLNAQR